MFHEIFPKAEFNRKSGTMSDEWNDVGQFPWRLQNKHRQFRTKEVITLGRQKVWPMYSYTKDLLSSHADGRHQLARRVSSVCIRSAQPLSPLVKGPLNTACPSLYVYIYDIIILCSLAKPQIDDK